MRGKLFVALLVLPTYAGAQTDTGGYVARLGNDTLAIESFTRTPQQLTGRSLLRQQNLVMREYAMDFRPDGSVRKFQVRTYPYILTKQSPVTYSDANGNTYSPMSAPTLLAEPDTIGGIFQSFEYNGDSVTVTTIRGKNPARVSKLAAIGNALPFSENMYGVWQEMAGRARTANEIAFLAGNQPLRYSVERPGAGRLVFNGVSNDFGPMLVATDAQGRLTQLDMRATTDKYLVDRVASVDLEKLARTFATRPLVLSPRDTVRFSAAGANVSIDYSKPSVRGRTIFGGTQPWGVVWRAGADAATQLMTDKNLQVGDTTIPAGTYTLWVIPAQDGNWTFIINRQHGQWGTSYDQKQDLMRIPVKVSAPAMFAEQMRFILSPSVGGGTIWMQWEKSQFSVPFQIKP